MTVKDLIERLQAMPQDLPVLVDYDRLWEEATEVQLTTKPYYIGSPREDVPNGAVSVF